MSRAPNPTQRNHLFRAVAGAAIFLLGIGCGDSDSTAPAHPEVYVTDVKTEDVPIFAEWVGSTEGYNNANIRPQVKGYLLKINYQQGTLVQKNQLLFQIDPQEFQAEVENALGELGQAKAMLGRSNSHVRRYRPLAAQGAVSEQELDDAVQAKLKDEASVVSAQARVDQAKLNLGWTQIKSPISGVAGIAIAQIGDLLTPESVLTTVSQLNPIKVQFPISEQQYLELVKYNKGASEGKIGQLGATLELYLSDGQKWPESGTPYVLGREVDPLTGTIVVEGRFPNPKNVLRPGQFARVRAQVALEKDALVIPQKAVNDVQGTYNVYVVKDDDSVDVRAVEIGETYGTDWIIKKGLSKGESIIVEGFQRVRSGMKVDPKPMKASKTDDSKKPKTPSQPSPS